MGMKKTDVPPSNDLTGVIETPQPAGTPGPPIDDSVCIPKPPATGSWRVDAVDGVIQGLPTPWVQN
jgi:hypothetical protein